jgi:hypothetical protein
MFFIYHWIPRKLGFLGWLAILIPFQSVAFLRLLVAFTTTYNIKVLISRYQLLDMHCIVFSVKFDGALSISFVRNKQLYQKMVIKSSPCQKSSDFWKLSDFRVDG